MKPLALSQSAEIAAFAEANAVERFGRPVRVSIRNCQPGRLTVLFQKFWYKPKLPLRPPVLR